MDRLVDGPCERDRGPSDVRRRGAPARGFREPGQRAHPLALPEGQRTACPDGRLWTRSPSHLLRRFRPGPRLGAARTRAADRPVRRAVVAVPRREVPS